MQEMNKTSFKQLVVGEKFKLLGSDMLMVKEVLRREPGLGWVNATYDITHHEQPCYIHADTQVVRRRSNQGTEWKRSSLNTGCGDVR
jgi:hypothetical protein